MKVAEMRNCAPSPLRQWHVRRKICCHGGAICRDGHQLSNGNGIDPTYFWVTAFLILLNNVPREDQAVFRRENINE